ncbi:hypothetical protein BGZ80_004378 [Entomortierella chlamydospora]|uniref:Major facilitator superfamily (MFS) profile domain-containing protein n=1 Tax=Entomortierella chlamydospora TaxID=101097 RepID=A0A9P6SVY2_9FUNG|nr:hypothetical protein BGZ80_004378 [Entomortierella chlamydospora]
MSYADDPLVTESTALLEGCPSISTTTTTTNAAKSPEHRKPTWLWPWQPNYWAAVFVIFLVGVTSGPIISLAVPSLKELFCERGIPTLFPIHNRTSSESNNDQAALARNMRSVDDGHCDSAEYSAAIAKFAGLSTSLAAVLVTLTVRFWSALGDRVGRKRAMQICICGMLISTTLSVIVRLNKGVSLYFLMVGEMIEGATGAALSFNALTHAYAADVTLPEERTVVFGRLQAGLYCGIALGSTLGGMVASKFGISTVFIWMTPSLVVVNFIYISLMPESLSASVLAKNRSQHDQAASVRVDHSEESEPTDLRQPPPIMSKENITQRLDSFIKGLMPNQLPNRLSGKHSVLMLMITMFLVAIGTSAAISQMPSYLLFRFHWNESMLSSLITVIGITRLISMTTLLPIIKRSAPHDALADPVASINYDLKVAFIGLIIETVTLFWYGITPFGEGFYLGGAVGSIGAIFSPAVRGIITQSVAPEQLGTTMGTLVTFESLAAVGTPLLSSLLYGATLETWPSAVFYVSGFLSLASTLLALSVYIKHHRGMHH